MSEGVAATLPKTPTRGWAAIARRFAVYGGATGARLVGIDIARGIAVLGMFVAHTFTVDAFEWARPETWLDVANGRSSILFATLAGVSIALISGRRVPLDGTDLLQARMRIVIRAVVIFALGGVLEFLGTPVAVILPMYAVLFVVSLPFLRWRARSLFILAGSLAVAMPILQRVLAGFLGQQGTTGVIVDLFVTGTYPGMIWIVFLLLGLAIGRLDLSALRVRLWLLGAGLVLALVGYGIGAAADALQSSTDVTGSSSSSGSWTSGSSGSEFDYEEGVPSEDIDFSGLFCDRYDDTVSCYPEGYYEDFDEDTETPEDVSFAEQVRIALSGIFTAHAHSGTTIEVLASGGFALVVIVLSLFAATARVSRWILFPVAAVGSMALSAYSGHIVALAIFGAFGFADELTLGFVVTALVACSLWALLIGRGPLERLLTCLSHRAAKINHPLPRD